MFELQCIKQMQKHGGDTAPPSSIVGTLLLLIQPVQLGCRAAIASFNRQLCRGRPPTGLITVPGKLFTLLNCDAGLANNARSAYKMVAIRRTHRRREGVQYCKYVLDIACSCYIIHNFIHQECKLN